MAGSGGARGGLTLDDIVSNEVALGEGVATGHRVRVRNGRVPVLVALVVVVCVVFTTVRYMAAAERVSVLRADYTQARAVYVEFSEKLVDARTQGALLLVNCRSSVDDEALCEALQESVESAELVDVGDPGAIDPYEASALELEKAIGVLREINGEAGPAYDSLKVAMGPVHERAASKTREDFDKALVDGAELVARTRDLVARTDSKVLDESVRSQAAAVADGVEAAIAEARLADDGTLRDYTGVTTRLDAAIEVLRERHAALEENARRWEQEERIKRAKASASAAAKAKEKAERDKEEAEAKASAAASASTNVDTNVDEPTQWASGTTGYYRVPDVEGIDYYVNGVKTAAGTYTVTDSQMPTDIVVEAKAKPGYSIKSGSNYNWTLRFYEQ